MHEIQEALGLCLSMAPAAGIVLYLLIGYPVQGLELYDWYMIDYAVPVVLWNTSLLVYQVISYVFALLYSSFLCVTHSNGCVKS